eukprot:1446463-Prymnesium_polylepis.1
MWVARRLRVARQCGLPLPALPGTAHARKMASASPIDHAGQGHSSRVVGVEAAGRVVAVDGAVGAGEL